MASNAERTFLPAILANPDDDAPRLVCADWLEEHGDPARAEFIRVQCQLATMPSYDPRWSLLSSREKTLLEAHAGKWLGPLAHIEDRAANIDERWTFQRGFVEWASLAAQTFLEHGEELVELTPLRRVHLLRAGPLLKDVLASPQLTRVRELSLVDNRLGRAGFRRLAAAPGLSGVRELFLGGTWINPDDAAELAACPYLSGLTGLNLCFTPVGDDGIAHLANSPHLAGL